jgi:uncharacterized protein (DUF305 family)
MSRHALERSHPRTAGRATSLALFILTLTAGTLAVSASDMNHPMAGGESVTQSQMGVSTAKPFAALMEDATAGMDDGMKRAPMTGDPDHDFAAMMVPHHQGAIDMAKAELLYGKNPVLRRLAQEIIVTQASEITVMETELKKPSASGTVSH